MLQKSLKKFILIFFILSFMVGLSPVTCLAQWRNPSFGFNPYWGGDFEWMPPYFAPPPPPPMFPYLPLRITDAYDPGHKI